MPQGLRKPRPRRPREDWWSKTPPRSHPGKCGRKNRGTKADSGFSRRSPEYKQLRSQLHQDGHTNPQFTGAMVLAHFSRKAQEERHRKIMELKIRNIHDPEDIAFDLARAEGCAKPLSKRTVERTLQAGRQHGWHPELRQQLELLRLYQRVNPLRRQRRRRSRVR